MSDHTTLKTCTQCGQSKPATPEYFTRTKSTKDGLHTQCKECKQKNDRARWAENADELNAKRRESYPERADNRNAYHKEWRAKNQEGQRAKKKAAYWADPEADKARSRAWRDANKEYRAKKASEYAKANREKIQAKQRKWEAENRERLNEQRRPKRRINQNNREARKLSLPNTFTEADWQTCLDYFGGACAVCGRAPGLFYSLAMDHWVPLSNPDCPGTVVENIVPLCHGWGGCNNSKHSKDANAWLTEKFGKEKAKAVMKKIRAYFKSVGGRS